MKTVSSGMEGVMRNHRFVLAIGQEMLSFSKVSNISQSVEYDTITEGGLNSMVHTFTKARQQPETLVLEKGVNISRQKDSEKLEKLGLKPGGRIKQAVTLVVLGDDQKMERRYGFDEGIVIKWEISGLDAMGSEVLIEHFEIAHSGLKELV